MSRKRFYPTRRISYQAALEAVLGILEHHPLSLYCPQHKSVSRAVEYIPRQGHLLACGCTRPTELGQKEPSVIKLAQLWHCFDTDGSVEGRQTHFQPPRATRGENKGWEA